MANPADVVVDVPYGKQGIPPPKSLGKVGSEAEIGYGTPVVFKVCCLRASV